MSNPTRCCPVCNCDENRLLFRQSFDKLSQGSLLDGYAIVVCSNCGAGFAEDIPDRVSFDLYYAQMSKYEHSERAEVHTKEELDRFREIADLVSPHLKDTSRILDVGCATGGLLAEFKRRGFSNLLGVDPSPTCAKLTGELLSIPAKVLTIAHLSELGEQVDVVFLTGVLEHLPDVDSSLHSIKSCLHKGAFLFIVVPDATCYDRHFSAPFQFFSMEHINYFSPRSLSNLMARHGFSEVFSQRSISHLSPQSVEPVICTLFRWNLDDITFEFIHDDETKSALERYIKQSQDLEKQIQEKIDELVDASKPLAVWGVGTHTLRLLTTSRLAQAQIISFIDSNVHYQGKTLSGVPVVSPTAFNDSNAEILISAPTGEQQISQTISQELRWTNRIHRLYTN
jgi:SAM-dependent methyltransferase